MPAKKQTVAKESKSARQARHEATHAAIAKAGARAAGKALARPAAAPPAAPVPAPAPAPAAAKPAPRCPLGVYVNDNRNTAIAFRHSERGVWYLTMITGQITLEHHGDEKFMRDWPLQLPLYPFRRAVRLYKDSYQIRDDQADKVMKIILRSA